MSTCGGRRICRCRSAAGVDVEAHGPQHRAFHTGDKVRAKILAIGAGGALVDLWGKERGVLDLRDLVAPDALLPAVGDSVDVLVLQDGTRGGNLVVTRDPGRVRVDIASGALPADMAERVYGVVPGEDATRALRADRLATRLASAVPPAVAPATVPDDVPLRPLAGELAVIERDGRPEAFVSLTGRVVLARAGGNFKDGCAVLERPLHDVAPEFATREGRAGQRARYREYLCPVTGLRVDSEIIKEGDEALHDIEIGAGR